MILMVWGKSESTRGKIVELDPNTKKVHVAQYGESVVKIPFMDIMKVESISL